MEVIKLANNVRLAPHEMIEFRELMTNSILGAKTLANSLNLVTDEELKSFMQNSLSASKASIQAMQKLVDQMNLS